MVGTLFLWNWRRLVRRPRYAIAMLVIAFVTVTLLSFAGWIPAVVGILLVSAMGLGFVAPCVGSVAAEARYLLTRSCSRTACFIAWAGFAIVVMSAAPFLVEFFNAPPRSPNGIDEVIPMDLDTRALLTAKGFTSWVVDKEHPDLVVFSLPGYRVFVSALATLSALMGVFLRLREVQADTHPPGVRQTLAALLSKGPLVALFLAWLIVVRGGRATHVVILSYLHSAWVVGMFAVGAAATAALSWWAWARSDVQ